MPAYAATIRRLRRPFAEAEQALEIGNPAPVGG
jgi:hypothetical protein